MTQHCVCNGMRCYQTRCTAQCQQPQECRSADAQPPNPGNPTMTAKPRHLELLQAQALDATTSRVSMSCKTCRPKLPHLGHSICKASTQARGAAATACCNRPYNNRRSEQADIMAHSNMCITPGTLGICCQQSSCTGQYQQPPDCKESCPAAAKTPNPGNPAIYSL